MWPLALAAPGWPSKTACKYAASLDVDGAAAWPIFIPLRALAVENWPLGRCQCRTACKYAVNMDVDVTTLRPSGQFLYRFAHWPSKIGLFGRRRCRTAGKYAVNMDVDITTLRPFGQFLSRSAHWLSKLGLSAGAGAEFTLVSLSWPSWLWLLALAPKI